MFANSFRSLLPDSKNGCGLSSDTVGTSAVRFTSKEAIVFVVFGCEEFYLRSLSQVGFVFHCASMLESKT